MESVEGRTRNECVFDDKRTTVNEDHRVDVLGKKNLEEEGRGRGRVLAIYGSTGRGWGSRGARCPWMQCATPWAPRAPVPVAAIGFT